MFGLFKKSLSKSIEKHKQGEALFLEGMKNALSNKYDEAINFFTQSIEINNESPAPYVNRGAQYQLLGRYLEAWDDYSMALKMEESKPSADAKTNIVGIKQNMDVIKLFMDLEETDGEMVRNMLKNDGIQHFSKRWSEEVIRQALKNNLILTRNFVFGEFNELYELGGKYREYALSTSLSENEYLTKEHSEETSVAYIFFRRILCCFSRDPETMFEVKKSILNNMVNLIKN